MNFNGRNYCLDTKKICAKKSEKAYNRLFLKKR